MHALVLGANGGLGRALADALVTDFDAEVVRVSRSGDGLDLTSDTSAADHAGRLSGERFDLILVSVGALTVHGTPPEKSLAALDPAVMAASYAANAIAPAMALKHFSPLLRERGRSVFAALSARLASIGDNGLGGWTSYRASKSALNQILVCGARELRRTRPDAIVASLHPGTVETPLSRPYARGRYTATPEVAARQLLTVLGGLGPGDSGTFWDYAGKPIPW